MFDIKNATVMVLEAGFKYSSQDISLSLHRALERTCGADRVTKFNTSDALKFGRCSVTAWNTYIRELPNPIPTHKDVVDVSCDTILRYAALGQIDLIIAVHGLNINTVVMDAIRVAFENTKTALWLVDEPQQVDLTQQYSSHYDYVFTNDRNTLKMHGEGKTFYLPTAFDDEIFAIETPVEDKYKSDVLISGSLYPERVDFIEKLFPHIQEYDIKVVGKIIQRGREFKYQKLMDNYNAEIVDIEEMAKYMAGAKICLDIPRRTDISEYGRTNSSGISPMCASPRIFEIAASGSLILTDDSREAVGELFAEDEFALYKKSDENSCANAIVWYMRNENERKEIVEKAKKRAFKEHTYMNRVQEIASCLPDKNMNARLVGLNLDKNVQNSIAKHRFFDIWQQNIKDNVEFADLPSLNEFSEGKIGEGKTALVISNAPSLEDNIVDLQTRIHDFKDREESFDIFSVNSAYKELSKRNIVPKFHVQIHPTSGQEKHYVGYEREESYFLPSLLLDNNAIKNWKFRENIRPFMPMGAVKVGIDIPEVYSNKFSLVPSAIVVGFTATAIAIHFGYKKIAWIGFDFAFTKNQKYAFQKCHFDEEVKGGFVVRQDMHGSPIITSHTMLDACEIIVNLTNGHTEIDFFNLTNAGILYGSNIRQMSLRKFFNDYIAQGETVGNSSK